MDLLRTFLPLHNPIGFGASDFIELVLAALLVWFALTWRSWIGMQIRKLALSTGWSMLVLALLPITLRLLLLPRYPIPTPNVSDDFSYLLLADTLRHFRLANEVHPLHQFFETFFVLQEPSYSSIFPLGQAMALALGWTVFGHPWAGVALSIGAFCGLCYWMLRAWTTPAWALAGGLLAVMQFGPLNQWMNSFWGGAVSATAGCLVFGALPRMLEGGRTRDGVLLGLGLALQLLTRPFEFVLLLLCVILFFLPALRDREKYRVRSRSAIAVILVMLPAAAIMLLQNKQVTGSWTTLPYMLSRYQYGVPATFTVQPNPIPHRQLTAQQQLDYDVQAAVHGNGTDTLPRYLERFASRLRFYRFFFLAPLYLALPAVLWRRREYRFAWTILAVPIFMLGTNFYPYFYSHYVAAVTCLFVLISVTALDELRKMRIRNVPVGQDAARLILFLCGAHFIFWYGLHALASDQLVTAMGQYETWDAINQDDPEGRIAVNNQLAQIAGKQLVFVRYWPLHKFEEWVHNAADIDGSRVVWARDLGPEENEKLRNYYRDRTAWLLEPDFHPPRLRLYQAVTP